MQFLPEEILQPCRIFGWLPLKYVEDSGKKVLKFSYGWFFWGLTVTLTYNIFTLFALHEDFVGRLEGQPIRMLTDTSSFTVLLDIVTLCTLGIIVFVSSSVRYQQFIDLCYSLQKLDEDFQLNVKEKKYLKYKINIFLTLKLVMAILTIYYFSKLFRCYTVYIPFWITYFIQATVLVFFINICSVINERFFIINEEIRKETINQSFGQLLRGVEECQEKLDYDTGVSTLTKIKSLTELHWLMYEITRKANKFLSLYMLFSVISLSVHTIIALFYAFSQIWPRFQHELVAQLVIRSIWAVIHSTELLIFLRASTSVTETAHETAPMICKLMNRNLSAPLKKHLQIFLLSLRHQKPKFSALGLFQVQSHILIPISGAVTTYLVILIQFQSQSP